jgi:hypothetical protein
MKSKPATSSKIRRSLLPILGLILAVYIGSYAALSRRGYAEAKRWDAEGFYYFTPENTDTWRWKNRACVIIFWPINFVDRILGLGRDPAHEPMFEFS